MPEPATKQCPQTVYVGLFLLCAATLLLEVVLTRILSVSLWYHFAFMVVSTALFGSGLAGVALAARRNPGEVSAGLVSALALCCPVAFVVGYVLLQLVPFEPFSLAREPRQWLFLPLSYLAAALPFFASGATIAALLTRHADRVHRLYLADLAGAGVGCLLVAGSLLTLGGSGAVLLSTALSCFAAALIAWADRRALRALAIALGLLCAALSPFGERLIPIRITKSKVTGNGVPVEQVLRDPRFTRFSGWNTLSRVDVIEFRDGQGRLQRSALIDAGTAVTRLAHPPQPIQSLGPTADEEGFFVRILSAPSVLVIGSGGGREVLLSLQNGASHVTAVEINGLIQDLVTRHMADFTGHLYADPRVSAVTDEARSFLRRSAKRYDLISCPHTISNAALVSGALSLAENHLLTREAFEDYLDHLSDAGILVITRPEAHLPRLFATLRATATTRSPGDLEGRILAWRERGPRSAFYAGLAFRKTPFSPAEVSSFRQILARRGLEPLFLPGGPSQPLYEALLRSSSPWEVAGYPFLLEPASDDRPFFNRRVPLSALALSDLLDVFSQGEGARFALEDRPVAEAALIILLLESAVLTLLFLLLPMWLMRRRGLAVRAGLSRVLVFFLLGLAYIVIEVGFVQRFTLYLGSPVVVFSTVLGTLLIGSGLGSLSCARWSRRQAPTIACAGVAVVILVLCLLAIWLTRLTLAWPLPARILLASLLVFPAGLVMGMPFPLWMDRLRDSHPEHISWAFGVNGFASVIGTIAAVILGMTAGYTCVWAAGVSCYALAAACSWFAVRPSGPAG